MKNTTLMETFNQISILFCLYIKRGSRGAARAAKSLRWSV